MISQASWLLTEGNAMEKFISRGTTSANLLGNHMEGCGLEGPIRPNLKAFISLWLWAFTCSRVGSVGFPGPARGQRDAVPPGWSHWVWGSGRTASETQPLGWARVEGKVGGKKMPSESWQTAGWAGQFFFSTDQMPREHWTCALLNIDMKEHRSSLRIWSTSER